MTHPVIAIDGPSASGKGTVASRLAQNLGWTYLDSGALYRLTALQVLRAGIDPAREGAVFALARDLPARFEADRIYLGDEDVGALIRDEAVGMLASRVAAQPAVRGALLKRQRDFAEVAPTVADGRDMGSVVFPRAELKVFLTASAPVRAARRAKQLGLPEDGEDFRRILADIEERDRADRERPVAPLRRLPEAMLLDTSDLTIDEAVARVAAAYEASRQK